MWNYTDKVKDHYLHPRNVGEIEKPDGIGEVGNLKCGDALRLTFKLDENGRIADIKFKTFGCGSAIASSSVLTEMCKGKTLEEVKQITNKDIASALGGLPQEKMHCSVMGEEALHKAIEFYNNRGQITTASQKHGEIICVCFNVTDEEIIHAIQENNLTTVEQVTFYTKAGGGCGGCVPQIEELLVKVNGSLVKEKDEKQPVKKTLTTLQKIDLVRSVLDKEIRPQLQKDGGDCDFVDIEGDTVFIRFQGQCRGCSFAQATKYEFIEKKFKELVSPDIIVRESK